MSPIATVGLNKLITATEVPDNLTDQATRYAHDPYMKCRRAHNDKR